MRGASRTAEVVAAMRVLETARADSALQDPQAARFLGLPLRALARGGVLLPAFDRLRRSGLTNYIVTRHAWMDEQLRGSSAAEVLILGAGYDTRAIRIGGARYWEVDHPATAARKRRLSPDHPAIPVHVDFQRQGLAEELLRAGFPRGVPTFVIWEGVTMYLHRAAVQHTLGVLASLVGSGSTLVLDALGPSEGTSVRDHAQRLSAALMPLIGEPVTFQPHPEELVRLLDDAGWRADEVLSAKDLAQRFAPGRFVFPLAYGVRSTLR